jgi:uncharacterized protein YecE (DUF72 family)
VQELDVWVDRTIEISRKTKDTYVMSNNHNLGKAAVNALQFTAIVQSQLASATASGLAH